MTRSRRDTPKSSAVRYDLILKGGECIDPATGRRGQCDIAFAEGKVAAIEGKVDPAMASQVERVDGAYIVPGLIANTALQQGVGVTVGLTLLVAAIVRVILMGLARV